MYGLFTNRSGYQTREPSLIPKIGIGGLLNYWHQASRYFKDNDYDVVWLQNPFILTGNPFKRCLVTMHSTYYGSSTHGVGTFPLHLYKSLVAHIERYCLTRMPPDTLFTGVGQPVCEELEEIGVVQNMITCIPNGLMPGSSAHWMIRNRCGRSSESQRMISFS